MKIKKIMLIVLAVSMFVLTGCYDGASLEGVKNKNVQSDLYLNMDAGSNDLILLSQQSKDNATLSNDNRSNANDNGRESAEIGDTVILDGVVYSKNMDTLISYPRDKSDKSYTVPSDVKHIADYAFASNPYIENVVFPLMAKTLGEGVFSGCTALKSVTFPFVTAEIGKEFFAASGVEEITIPGSVKVIRTNAFRDCKGLKKMIIPRSVTVIESFAFAGCASLGEVEFEDPSFVPSGDSVFWGTPWYKAKVRYNPALWFSYVMKGEELILERYHGPDKSVSLPEGTTAITETAFMYSDIEAAELPVSMLTHECTYIGADKKECTFVPKKNEALSKAFPDLKRFAVSGNEQTECVSGNKFFEENGAVYYGTKENKVLYAYPAARADEFTEETKETVYEDLDGDGLIDIILPSKTEYLKRDTFKGYTNVGTIYIPATLTDIPVFEKVKNTVVHAKKVVYMDGTRSISGDNDIGLGTYEEDSHLSGIALYAFHCDEVVIPSSVVTVKGLFGFNNLKRISLDENNVEFTMSDGVLYSADMTRLIVYPTGKENKEFTVPDGVIVVNYSAFKNNEYLEKVVFSNSVMVLEDAAFSDCVNLKEIVFSENIISVGRWALSRVGINELILPDSVTKIDYYTFSGCQNLVSVYIPSSVKSIGEYAFSGCSALLNVVFEDESETVYSETSFNGTLWDNLQKADLDAKDFVITVSDDGMVVLEKYLGNSESVVIPKGVILIADDAFEGKKVTEVTFPASMFNSRLTGNLFKNNSTISDIFPHAVNYRLAETMDRITEIDGVLYAYLTKNDSECTLNITAFPAGKTGKYVLPDNAVHFAYYAFKSTSLEEITFSENFTEFYNFNNFVNIPNLKRINLSSATKINSAYSDVEGLIYVDGKCIVEKETICEDIDGDGLIDIKFPSTMRYIDRNIFLKYDEVGTVYIPANIEKLPIFNRGDRDKIRIKKIVYEDGITEIAAWNSVRVGDETGSSYSPRNLECDELYIPSSIKKCTACGVYGYVKNIRLDEENEIITIKNNAFYSKDGTVLISALAGKATETYVVPNGVVTIRSGAFLNCDKLKKLVLSDSVKTIESLAFWLLNDLNEIVFSKELEVISDEAFRQAKIKSLVFPDKLTEIGKGSFLDCRVLEYVYIPASVSYIGEDAFKGCTMLSEVIFEDETKTKYHESAFVGTPWAKRISTEGGPSDVPAKTEADKLYDEVFAKVDSKYKDILGENDILILADEDGKAIRKIFDISHIDTLYVHPDVKDFGSVSTNQGVTVDRLYYHEGTKKITYKTMPYLNVRNEKLTSDNQVSELNCKEIYVPSTVTDIEPYFNRIFAGLEKVTVSSSNKEYVSIDGVLYSKTVRGLICYPNSKKGESYTIPDTVVVLAPSSFCRAANLKIVNIPKSVYTIHDGVFAGCTSLEEVNFEQKINVAVPSTVFWGTPWYINGGYGSVVEHEMNISNDTMYYYHYNGNGHLELPKEIVHYNQVNGAAFIYSDITSMTLPKNPNGNGINVDLLKILHIPTLLEYILPEGITTHKVIDGCLYSADGTHLVSVPSGKTGTLVIPDGVVHIDQNALKSISLEKIVIPDSVKTVGSQILDYAASYEEAPLKEIVIPESLSHLKNAVFKGYNVTIAK